jgi:diguanylate cyclase (GGDEF)-like protein/PAS domain S-box-containing protein
MAQADRYRELVETAADAIVAADAAGRVVVWNDAASRMFGYSAAAMLGKPVTAVIAERFTRDYQKGFSAAVRAGRPRITHLSLLGRHADGTEFPIEVAVSISGAGPDAVAFGIVRKMSERFEKLALLEENERRLRDAEHLAKMGSFEWNVASDTLTWSDELYRIFGFEPGQHASTLEAFLERVHSGDRELLLEKLRHAITTGEGWSIDERIERADTGETRILASSVRAVKDSEGKVVRLCGTCQDVTQQRRAEALLRHRALHDSLTGLPNRELLLDRLDGALYRAARNKAFVCVLFLDVDNFKIINDTIGHASGDELLRTMAARLAGVCRAGDTCARVGGDEFVMICENVEQQSEILTISKRVSETLAAPIAVGGSDLIATVSIGIAVADDRAHTPEQLLRDADLAMYRAKQHGKNTVEMFDEALRRHARERVQVERELRGALQSGEIFPYYQPIVELATEKVRGFEALVRWQHPARGLLGPNEFLSVAEDAHLIGILGEVMLDAVCAQLASWRQNGSDAIVAVNLSLRQLDGKFKTALLSRLERFGIPRDALHVEVTESVLLDLNKSSGALLTAIAESGICVGIDDFGTGYSSLLYLKRFPVGFLKIDKSFVHGLPGDRENVAIMEAIVRLAKNLELSTIAEGVETAEQLASLRRFGCTYAQGNYISPPLPAAECSPMLTRASSA